MTNNFGSQPCGRMRRGLVIGALLIVSCSPSALEMFDDRPLPPTPATTDGIQIVSPTTPSPIIATPPQPKPAPHVTGDGSQSGNFVITPADNPLGELQTPAALPPPESAPTVIGDGSQSGNFVITPADNPLGELQGQTTPVTPTLGQLEPMPVSTVSTKREWISCGRPSGFAQVRTASAVASFDHDYPPVVSNSRVIGGRKAQLGEFPSMVKVNTYYPPSAAISETHYEGCGGSIIGDGRWILTAAHCVTSKENTPISIEVSYGGITLGDDGALLRKAEAEAAFCPSTYQGITAVGSVGNPQSLATNPTHDDIALIRLRQPIDIRAPNVRPVDLPSPSGIGRVDAILQNPAAHIRPNPTVLGFGFTDSVFATDSAGNRLFDSLGRPLFSTSPNLLAAKVQISFGSQDGETIVTGNPQTETNGCQGDSGGPLLFPNGSGTGHELIGVLSYTWPDKFSLCKNKGNYVGFTRVSRFLGDINRVMSQCSGLNTCTNGRRI